MVLLLRCLNRVKISVFIHFVKLILKQIILELVCETNNGSGEVLKYEKELSVGVTK